MSVRLIAPLVAALSLLGSPCALAARRHTAPRHTACLHRAHHPRHCHAKKHKQTPVSAKPAPQAVVTPGPTATPILATSPVPVPPIMAEPQPQPKEAAPKVAVPEEEAEPPSVPHVQVSAIEWAFTLSRTTVPAGKVVLEFVNSGQDEHNLNFIPPEGPSEEPVANTPAKGIVDVALQMQPGSYTLFCSLPTHEQKGMKATLTVE